MFKNLILITLILLSFKTLAQKDYMPELNFIEEGKVQMRLSYMKFRNSTLFSAYNELEYPVFLHIHFKDVSKLSFFEEDPYVKRLPHGLTDLFVLEKSHEHNLFRFPFEIKIYPSNPLAVINLEFPYLLPFNEGETAIPVQVDTNNEMLSVIPNKEDGFFYAFHASSGKTICACRKGIVVNICLETKAELKNDMARSDFSYITLLHEDGTLATYFNVVSVDNKLKLNQTIYPGEAFSKINSTSNELIVAVYYNRLFSDDYIFLSPKFHLADANSKTIEINKKYKVVHPKEICMREMNKKEKKKATKTMDREPEQ